MKIRMVIMIILVFTILLGGCSVKENKPLWEELGITKEAFFVNHMEEKYGEGFSFLEDYEEDNSSKVKDAVYLSHKDYPGLKIIANYYPESQGLSDEFMTYHFLNRAEAELRLKLEPVLDDFQVYFYQGAKGPNTIREDMSTEEFLMEYSSYLGIPFDIVVEAENNQDELEDMVGKIVGIFKESGYLVSGRIIFLNEGIIEEIDRDTFKGYMSKEEKRVLYHTLLSFDTDENGAINYEEWMTIDE